MFSNGYVAAKGMGLALLALLVTAGICQGQPAGGQGTGWVGGAPQVPASAGGFQAYYRYSAPGYTTAPGTYSAPGTYVAPAAGAAVAPAGTSYQSLYPAQFGNTGYQSFYPPQYGNAGYESFGTLAARNRNVTVNVSLPANARISFDGTNADRATGTFRQFVSPPIARGQDFAYDVKVSWMQDGKEVTQTRHIAVHAGDVINLTFGPSTENRASANTNPPRND